MATIIGQSGAYRKIVKDLREVGLDIGSIAEVQQLRSKCAGQEERIESETREEFARVQQDAFAAIAQAELWRSSQIAARLPEFDAMLMRLTQASKSLRSFRLWIRSPSSFLQWLQTKQEIAKATNERSRFLVSLDVPFRQWQAFLDKHQRGERAFFAQRLDPIRRQLELLNHVIQKGELAGADAELKVIGELGKLPDEWVIVNDVRLKANRWYYKNGHHLRTAQLDHVAVGPKGIFVIETKNWSRETASSGELFSPYEQVDRASYLLCSLLKQAGVLQTTRAIIASNGFIPAKPSGTYTATRRPDQLCSYLLNVKDSKMPVRIREVVGFLSARAGS